MASKHTKGPKPQQHVQTSSSRRQLDERKHDLPVRERRRKVGNASSSELGTVDEPGSNQETPTLNDHGSPTDAATRMLPTSTAVSRVRFSSNSPALPLQSISRTSNTGDQHQQQIHERDNSEDEEDEAPEVISHSLAEAGIRAAQIDETNARKQLEVEAKTKRRKHDQNLKEQVKVSNRRQNKRDIVASNINGCEDLPSLLPEEMLVLEQPLNKSTSLITDLIPKPSVPKKRQLVQERQQSTLQEIVRSDHKVRLLNVSNEFLPPKVGPISKNLRESWLFGRGLRPTRGQKSAPGHRRRVSSQPFV